MEEEVKEEQEEQVNKRAEKIKSKINNFLSKRHNQIFLAIFVFAILIRLYFFFTTTSQPLWWDEADYMAYAKTLAGLGTTWIVTSKHNTFLSYIAAGLMKIGFNESLIKFTLEVLPSIFLVLLVYKICILMYKDKRIALISSFLMATFWVVLFNSMRFHLGVPALFTALLAIFVFLQGHEKKQKIFGKIDPKWAMPIVAILVALTYSIRRGYFMVGFFFPIYMLFTSNIKKELKNKYNWIALVLILVLVLLAEQFIFVSPIAQTAESYIHLDRAIPYYPFLIFTRFLTNINTNDIFFPSAINALYYLFWIGFAIVLINLILSFGYFKKIRENQTFRSDLFVIIMIVVVLAYFLFIQRNPKGVGEPRWYLPLALGVFIAISRGTLVISKFIKKYNKPLAIIFIILLIGWGGWYELSRGSYIIDVKKDTYSGIKQAGLLLNEISQPGDLIISVPIPQTAYYSERPAIHPGDYMEWDDEDYANIPLEDFLNKLRENKDAQYILVSTIEPGGPTWMFDQQYTVTELGGNVVLAGWIFPFTESYIDFTTGQQVMNQEVGYEDYGITFRAIDAVGNMEQGDVVFIYNIEYN